MKQIRVVTGAALVLLLGYSLGQAQQTASTATNRLIRLSNSAIGETTGVCCRLYDFLPLPDGEYPIAPLVMDANGALYSTTYTGGSFSNDGTVFELAPPSGGGLPIVESVLHNFGKTPSDGANPSGGLVLTKNGELYGLTTFGGPQNEGTVFRLKPPASAGGTWKETVLYSFGTNSDTDGANPLASLLYRNGVFYGTTSIGGGTGCGGAGCGTVFELTAPVSPATTWKETILYRFKSAQGAAPSGALIMDGNGVLYGTTCNGGTSDNGTVFALAPPASAGGKWTETVLHSFNGGDGANPYSALVFDKSGSLYGTTFNGGSFDIGVVFQLTPPASAGDAWTETVLHGFTLPVDSMGNICITCPNSGANPYAGLVITASGELYGTTVWGGESLAGEIFRLKPPASAGGKWTEKVVHSFTGQGFLPPGSDNGDGFNPYAGLILKNGLLYGTVQSGGVFNYGDVFQLAP